MGARIALFIKYCIVRLGLANGAAAAAAMALMNGQMAPVHMQNPMGFQPGAHPNMHVLPTSSQVSPQGSPSYPAKSSAKKSNASSEKESENE